MGPVSSPTRGFCSLLKSISKAQSRGATSTFPRVGRSTPELCDAIGTAPGLQPPTPASLCWNCLGLDYGTSKGSHPHNLIGIF